MEKFQDVNGLWYYIDQDGNKILTTPPQELGLINSNFLSTPFNQSTYDNVNPNNLYPNVTPTGLELTNNGVYNVETNRNTNTGFFDVTKLSSPLTQVGVGDKINSPIVEPTRAEDRMLQERQGRVNEAMYNDVAPNISDTTRNPRANNTNKYFDIFNVPTMGTPEYYNYMLGKSIGFDKDKLSNELTDEQKNRMQGANIARGIFAGLGSGLSTAKGVLAGMGEEKRRNFITSRNIDLAREATTDMYGKGREELFTQGYNQYTLYEDGGVHMDIAAENIKGVPSGMPYNAEVEKKEKIVGNDGVVRTVKGDSHEDGGEKIMMDEGERVISDNVVVYKKHRDIFKDYGIKLGKTTTYAEAVDKYEKKVGIEKLNEEQAKHIKELEKNSKIKDKETANKNFEYISTKINNVEKEKQTIQPLITQFSDMVFKLQEEAKQKEDVEKKRESDTEEMEYKDGGKSKWISDKISVLMKEGKPQDQAVAIAYSMAEKEYQDGGQAPQEQNQMQQIVQMIAQALQQGTPPEQVLQGLIEQGIPQEQAQQMVQGVMQQMQAAPEMKNGGMKKEEMGYYQDGGEYVYGTELPDTFNGINRGVVAVQDFLDKWLSKPSYQYSDVESDASKARLKTFLKDWGVDISDSEIDKADKTKLNEIAGMLQAKVIEKEPALAKHYGQTVAATRTGLQKAADEGWINPKDYPSLFNNGKAIIGTASSKASEDEINKLNAELSKLDTNKMAEYAKANYKDNEWYFRGIGTKTVEFDNEADFIKWKDDNKANKVEGANFYSTDKEGAYVKPVLYKEQKFDTKEEMDNWTKERQLDPNYKAFYNSDEEDVFIRPLYIGQPPAEEVRERPDRVEAAKETPIPPYKRTDVPNEGGVQFLMNQDGLPPDPLAMHFFNVPKLDRITPIKVSPETALRENARQSKAAMEMIGGNVGSQQGANLANMVGQVYDANNQIVAQTNAQNAQLATQANQVNLQQSNTEKQLQDNALQRYDELALTALDKTNVDIRNYYDSLLANRINAAKETRNLNILESMSPQYTFDSYGNVVYTNKNEVPLSQMSPLDLEYWAAANGYVKQQEKK